MLQYLDISNNQISDYSFLEKLTFLQYLSLRNNQLSDFGFLEKLTGLQYLDLTRNQISNISFLDKLIGLRYLNLSYNNKISDYSTLSHLSDLQNLELRWNQVSDIDFLLNLANMQTLNLENNNISDISSLSNLNNLQALHLSYNKISDYNILGEISCLKHLNLTNNKISDYNFLEKLTGLQHLNISNHSIPDYSFLEKLIGLQYLDLTRNQISDIRFIEKKTGLKHLILCYNQITDISSLSNLINLQTLKLDYNQITNINSLSNLIDLQTLELRYNQVSDINSLSKLTDLQSLNLESNHIKEVPQFIFHLNMEINIGIHTRGNELYLYGNPITVPPLEILKQGNIGVLNWFKAKKEKLNEIKIILIGDPKAGKTSLLRRLKNNSFNENEEQTDGINIVDIVFGECNTFKECTSLHGITGHFWDFGGQEIMNATHQFFLTKRSVYVLVLDARRDTNNSEQIRYWVQQVKATGGDSPIVVLANQIDVNSGFGFENQRELQEEFPQIKYFLKVSCKSNENIELLKKHLVEVIPTTELFHTEIDERWMTIKNILQKETKEKYYLNYHRFNDICEEVKLVNKSERLNAISFLHDLGLVLHFEYLEKKLSEYYVLDPYWITYGAYQILTGNGISSVKL